MLAQRRKSETVDSILLHSLRRFGGFEPTTFRLW
jgi:hypothetical protein